MKVTKLDAAKNQIETAISLYKNDVDEVSTHTLIAAAHQVLTDLCNKVNDTQPIIRNDKFVKEHLKPEQVKEYYHLVSTPQNFFKHSDDEEENSNTSLEFSPNLTDHFIFDSILMYRSLARNVSSNMVAMVFWYYIKYPDIGLKGVKGLEKGIQGLGKLKKGNYFKVVFEEPLLSTLNRVTEIWNSQS